MTIEPEEGIRKAPVKRVVQCGACYKWYRKSRMYHAHFEGIERIKTAIGVTEKPVDEDRLVCPTCYENMGYTTGKGIIPDDVEFVTDPNNVTPDEINQTLLSFQGTSVSNSPIVRGT